MKNGRSISQKGREQVILYKSKCAEIYNRMPLLFGPLTIDPWFHSSVEDLQPLIVPVEDRTIRIEHCVQVIFDECRREGQYQRNP